MPNRSSFADFSDDWELLLAAYTANATDLSYLEGTKVNLEATLSTCKTLSARQEALRAEMNQTTKQLDAELAHGRDLASRLRAGVRSRYGNKNEKLIEFRVRPFRPPKPPKKKEQTPAVPPPQQPTP
jgi:hypothetical protein